MGTFDLLTGTAVLPRDRALPSDTPHAAGDETGPLRRCVVTGAVRPKEDLLRFVAGPDGVLVPDVEGTLPGRGLWLTPRRDMVALARQRRAFSRAARQSLTAPEDLSDRVERLLAQRCLDIVSLARRAGQAVCGYEKVRILISEGGAALVLAARDGAAGGRAKIASLATGLPVIALFDAAELGRAFGRDHTVHAALSRGRLAERLLAESRRLAGFRGDAASEATPGEHAARPSSGRPAQNNKVVGKSDGHDGR